MKLPIITGRKKRKLHQVTLVAVACTKIDQTILAMQQSMKGLEFADSLLITHEPISLDQFGIHVAIIEKLDYKAYNEFILYQLRDYINTSHALLVQNDGFVLRPQKWEDDFLKYDYIGAPWTKDEHMTNEGVNVRVGNGGFTLRSNKLLNSLTELNLPFTDNGTGFFHEDGVLCSYYRKQLEDYGISYAPVEVASRFSRETVCDDSVADPFGFHGKNNVPKWFLLKSRLHKKLSPL